MNFEIGNGFQNVSKEIQIPNIIWSKHISFFETISYGLKSKIFL